MTINLEETDDKTYICPKDCLFYYVCDAWEKVKFNVDSDCVS